MAVAKLHFPGLHPDAAKWIVSTRPVKAVGIDTASIDYGQSKVYESHRILYDSNIPAFENMTALERLPLRGANLVALRVEVSGKDGRRAAWQLVDCYDERNGISAMMRTTGYSLAIIGLMQADGRITARGVKTPDEAVPYAEYVAELAKRGVEIKEV